MYMRCTFSALEGPVTGIGQGPVLSFAIKKQTTLRYRQNVDFKPDKHSSLLLDQVIFLTAWAHLSEARMYTLHKEWSGF